VGKYFGTDGVRGVANKNLTPELAFRLGRISGHVCKIDDKIPKVLIGRDTRVSGHMYEGALIAGLLSVGAEVMRLGVISTPGVAYLSKVTNAELGIMISASHNSFEDNGIKLFGVNGFKLSDEAEAEIEKLLDEKDTLPRPTGKDIGTVSNYFEGTQKYISYLQETIDTDFDGMKIAIDCAHGATSSTAAHLFADLEADILTIGNNPDGYNINDGVGSTYPESLQELVKEEGAHIGLAFDGDGDRLIAVDENGELVDGDKIMYIFAKYFKEQNRLNENTVVATVMSNLGLKKALEEIDITLKETDVGDRHVMEAMRQNNFNLGGEQSGHMILLDNSTTGDGMLSAVQLISIMKETGKKLSELTADITIYPQLLKNVAVNDKKTALEHPKIIEAIREVKEALGDKGRVLVRPSGTESLVRVMVEAETDDLCQTYVDKLVQVIEEQKL